MSLSGSDNVVRGNLIGTDGAGTAALGNGNGVQILGDDNVVAGTLLAAGNVISGNGVGVLISEGASDNRIRGNLIGTAVSGVGALGNGAAVLVDDGSGNTIGGLRPLHGNLIAFNGGGVLIRSGTGNAILSNAISSNGDDGIDLNVDGVTANDVGDGDIGPNGLQNYPVLTAAELKAGFTLVDGSLNSAANTVFRLQFFANPACDPSGHGEGGRFLGGALVTTDAAGDVIFYLFDFGDLDALPLGERLDRERQRAEMDAMVEEGHREALEAARNRPPPSTVEAYRRVFGHWPRGWPPWE